MTCIGPAGCVIEDARASTTCGQFDPAALTYAQVLSATVDGRGGVDYALLSTSQRTQLHRAGHSFSSICTQELEAMSQKGQMAFWINAYNLFTLIQIERHYPLKSIRNIGILPLAAWREAFISMPGLNKKSLSLNDIEHEILRKEFDDNRIHFAINCASLGCPRLRNIPWAERQLDRDLEQAAREFLADGQKNRMGDSHQSVALSRIFKWFRGDFETGKHTLASTVARWSAGEMAARLKSEKVEIEFLEYDWRLNSQDNMTGSGQ
jgi:hypothetical protein